MTLVGFAELIILIIILVLFYVAKSIRLDLILNHSKLNKLPGPPRKNVIAGSMAHLNRSPENIFKKLSAFAKTYYPIYQLNAAHLVFPFLVHPDDFEQVLSNQKHLRKGINYNILHSWLGTGLLTSDGLEWHKRRKLLTPTFHFSILQKFLDTFNKETKIFVEKITTLCDQPYVCVDGHITEFTLKTIAQTAMGTKLHFTTEKEINYKKAIYDLGEVLIYRIVHSWLMFDVLNIFSPKYRKEWKIVKNLQKFTRDVIAERERIFEAHTENFENHDVYKKKNRLAMLDFLLTAKNTEKIIDLEGIADEVNTFMFEGHDTVGAALGFALMLIACNPHDQDLILEEMHTVLGDVKKSPSFEEFQEMKYLERVIQEVLRLYPSVHFISRELGEELTTVSGYKLPQNTTVILMIYDLHHDPRIYPDPEKFDPDRFLPENCRNRHPFAYVPFSAGPRNCIGKRYALLELKAVLCGIVSNFVLEPVDTPDTIVLRADIVLRTKEDIKIKFVPRCLVKKESEEK